MASEAVDNRDKGIHLGVIIRPIPSIVEVLIKPPTELARDSLGQALLAWRLAVNEPLTHDFSLRRLSRSG